MDGLHFELPEFARLKVHDVAHAELERLWQHAFDTLPSRKVEFYAGMLVVGPLAVRDPKFLESLAAQSPAARRMYARFLEDTAQRDMGRTVSLSLDLPDEAEIEVYGEDFEELIRVYEGLDFPGREVAFLDSRAFVGPRRQ